MKGNSSIIRTEMQECFKSLKTHQIKDSARILSEFKKYTHELSNDIQKGMNEIFN
jgi:hypothetical protein